MAGAGLSIAQTENTSPRAGSLVCGRGIENIVAVLSISFGPQ